MYSKNFIKSKFPSFFVKHNIVGCLLEVVISDKTAYFTTFNKLFIFIEFICNLQIQIWQKVTLVNADFVKRGRIMIHSVPEVISWEECTPVLLLRMK